MEMHTVHLPDQQGANDDFTAAALGIMFSVNDYNVNLFPADQLVIDTFFESLEL